MPQRTRIALNIGGIANITVIPPRATPEQVIAFDTGPGNMVIDALAAEFSQGKLRCDRGGKIAASGKPNVQLLDSLLKDRLLPPPSAQERRPRAVWRGIRGAAEALEACRCAI